jgi:hypothetical protein
LLLLSLPQPEEEEEAEVVAAVVVPRALSATAEAFHTALLRVSIYHCRQTALWSRLCLSPTSRHARKQPTQIGGDANSFSLCSYYFQRAEGAALATAAESSAAAAVSVAVSTAVRLQ